MLNGLSSTATMLLPSPVAIGFPARTGAKIDCSEKRIVLPEGDEPRTIQAAAICQARGIADCILLAKPDVVQDVAKARGIELPAELAIVDPDSIRDQYVAPMVELRKGKLNELQAKEQLQDTVVLGTMMLALDQVDGLVSGAVHTTANTVRPAFQLIKTALIIHWFHQSSLCFYQMKFMCMATVQLTQTRQQNNLLKLQFSRLTQRKPLELTHVLP